MIGELVHLLLSILIRFAPLVGIKPIFLKSSRQAGTSSSFAVWIPILGWVAVSVKHAAAEDGLAPRVVSTRRWHGDSPFSGDQPDSRLHGLGRWNPGSCNIRFSRRIEAVGMSPGAASAKPKAFRR